MGLKRVPAAGVKLKYFTFSRGSGEFVQKKRDKRKTLGFDFLSNITKLSFPGF